MQTLVLIPDIQCPQHDEKAINVALKLIKYIQPTRAVFLGDVIAADSVSKYNKKTWAEAEKTLRLEIESSNAILDKFDAVFKEVRVKQIDYLEGNHENRIIQWTLKNARSLGELREMGLPFQLRLEQRKYNYIETQKQPLQVGKIHLVHGWYINQYHAAKTIRMTGRNTFYGHAHDWQVHTSSHYESEPARTAMSCGCLCNFRQHYLEGRPTNWMHGITIIYYDDDGFTPYFISIVNYRAIWNGKVFKA